MRELEGDLAPDEGDSDARQDAVTEGKEVGDVSTLADPSVMDSIRRP